MYRYTKDGNELGQVGTLGDSNWFEMSADQAYIFGADMTLSTGHNCVWRMRLDNGVKDVIITNHISQVRGMAWGGDGLLYTSGRGGNGSDYWGNSLVSGQYCGIQAFDVSNGNLPVLKRHYPVSCNRGACAVDAVRGCVYGSGNNKYGYVWGIAEESPDGESSDVWRAQPSVTLGNCFAGAMIAGYAYAADWSQTSANVYRYNHDGTATCVTNLTTTSVGGDGTISTVHAIRELVEPDEDTTLALSRLSDYWSFNHFGETSTLPADTFLSMPNPKRWARVQSGFTAGVRGVVREGLWCAAGAQGTLATACLVAQTNDFAIAAWIGFPGALDGAQVLFSNPKVSISITEGGALKADMPDGKDIRGTVVAGASVTGTSSLADGAWHFIAVMRRRKALEIWVDGAFEATSAETDVSTYDDLQTQWSLLKTENRNRMFLDEIRVYGAALAASDLKLLKGIATHGYAVPRDPALRSDAKALEIGTVVAHSDPTNHTWGVPMVVADADGFTLYAAADFARAIGENNQSVIWKSTDGGATWTRVRNVASLGAFTLFRFDSDPSGTFRSVGYDPDGGLMWAWSTTDGCGTFLSQHLQSATPLPRAWYPAPCPNSWARNVSLDEGFYCLDALVDGKGFLVGKPESIVNGGNVAGLHAGAAFLNANAQATAFLHQTVGTHGDATNAAPVETLGVSVREGENVAKYRGSASFPGASRPFGVVYDAASGRYWAAVTYAADDSSTPWLRANRLALYCAKDLTAWQKCTDLAAAGTPETVGFNTPNLIVLGDDLVVVFGASLDDTTGAFAARDVNASNYILCKRVTNFRNLAPAEDARRTRTMLVSDYAAERILRLEEDPDTGAWLNAGYFAPGSYSYGAGTDTMGRCDDMKFAERKVWILKNGRLYAFNPDGMYAGICHDLTLDRSVVPVNPDGLGLSYDRRYAYTTAAFPNKGECDNYIYRTDLKTGVTTRFCTSTDTGLCDLLYRVRTVEGLPDGSVAVPCRDGRFFFRLSAEGALIADSKVSVDYPQALFFDRRAQKLYASGFTKKLFVWDYRTGGVTYKWGMPDNLGITGDSRGRVFGTVYNNPSGLVDLLADNGALTTVGHREILHGGQTFGRCCFFDTKKSGLVLVFQ